MVIFNHMVKYSEKEISVIFHALADPTRREILKMVSKRNHQGSELAVAFDMSFPAVSKHLKVLEKSGFIRRDVDGRMHTFSFRKEKMKQAYQWIKSYEKFWLHNLDNLDQFLKED